MSQINHVIQEWVSLGRAFTAYEVSLEARKRGVSGRHKDLRGTIHQDQDLKDAVSFGGYQQSNVDVGGGIVAILYHPDTYNIANYQPLSRNNMPIVGSNVTSGQNLSSVVSPPQSNVNPSVVPTQNHNMPIVGSVYNLDHRNRLFVQKRFLADIGVGPSELVSIFKEGNALMVRKNKSGDSPLTVLTVERDGEIRIAQATLIAAGLTSPDFTIEVVGDVIEIENK